MKRIETIILIVILMGYIGFWYMLICIDTEDYFSFKKNENKYNIIEVKVEERIGKSSSHSRTAIFYYNDQYGIKQQGVINLNYNEKVGDYVEVAFDENMNYLRPIMTISIGGMFDYAILIFVGIAFFREWKKEKDAEKIYKDQ